MTPAEKLERSRLAIIEYLAKGERGQQQRARHDEREERGGQDDADGDGHGEAADGFFSRNPWFAGMSGAARTWWRHHPAQMAVEMATPALRSYMRRRPFQVLALSAGVGALLVVTRPWRLVSLTTLVVAVVKSSQLSGVVMSALADAQGWHEQQRGREPEL
jgi:hypothetical protein